MNFAGMDQAAAVADLIAFDGRVIEIDGRKYKAHIEPGVTEAEASVYGLDNRDRQLKATIVNRSEPPKLNSPVIVDGERYNLDRIEAAGRYVSILELSNA